MRWWAVLALLGCNQVFGLHHTRLRDAPFFDAPTDAPYACPDIGSGAPSFSTLVHPAIVQDCQQYSIAASGNRAVAICIDTSDTSNLDVFEQMPGDPQLTRAAGITRHSTSSSFVDLPHLTPDGATVWVRFSDYVNGVQTVSYSSYVRDGTGTWTHAMDLPVTGDARMSTIAPTSDGYRFFIAVNGASTLQEFTVSGGGAPVGGPTVDPQQTLGVSNLSALTLLPDGQRMLVHGSRSGAPGTFYSDRAAGGTFGQAALVMGPPQTAMDPFLAPDCSRIYFSENESSISFVKP